MEIRSIQSIVHTLLDRVVLERVFYGRDPHTGATVIQTQEYNIQVYNSRGLIVEHSQKGSSIDIKA